MLKEIQIEKLFGRFNYEFETMDDGVTIITGPNGFGKSTILRIINAISNANIPFFFDLDFSKLVVKFDNEEKIKIEKRGKQIIIDETVFPLDGEEYKEYFEVFQHQPWIKRVHNRYYDLRTDEFYTDEDFSKKLFYEEDRILGGFFGKKRKELDRFRKKFESIKKWCGEVRYISDQRLIRMPSNRQEDRQFIDVISELPLRLKREISKVSEEYSRVSNRLDSSYPKRLFAAREGIGSAEEYQERLKEINEKFEKLNKYNLVDMSIICEEEYNKEYATALKIYFDDFSAKYTVFQELITKLDLFTKIINNRLMFKQIKITQDNGFEVVDNDNPDKRMQLSQLSSGEKQEVVLFYDLIFSMKEKLLLLIDEPEISLHIVWQKKFLDDLIEVTQKIGLQVIVATHSPQIVSNHLDIQIDLGELYGEKLNSI